MKILPAFFSLALFMLVAACSKSKSDDSGEIIPANLQVQAVVNPDNSGDVSFTASADHAVRYDYDFGNGVHQTVTSGNVLYRYPASGTYSVTVLAKSSTNHTVSKTISITVTVTHSLVWSDEFNTPGAPDPAKWGYDLGNGSGGWGNSELQYYTNRPENVIVADGKLKITAKREDYNGAAFTSARILTKNKFSVKYGKVEVRAKLPTGAGTWPAIWMLGSNIDAVGWPQCGEIDIMEHKGSEPNKIYGTLHYPGHSGGNADGSTLMIQNASSEFHTYSMEWTATSIKFYVDNVLNHSYVNSASSVFNANFFFIMNVAMGGTFGGNVDGNFSQSQMEVDYIRVYN